MFNVHQDSIGTERFKSFIEAKQYLLDSIINSFSFVEVNDDDDDDNDDEVEYEIKVNLDVIKK